MQRCTAADWRRFRSEAKWSSLRDNGDEYDSSRRKIHVVNNHRKLKVWQWARELVGLACELADGLPERERFISVPQLLRAAWSVQNNIAEGYAKLGRRERRRFFGTAIGSLAEIDSITCKPDDLYEIDTELLNGIERLRQEINGGLFAVLRGKRKASLQRCNSAAVRPTPPSTGSS